MELKLTPFSQSIFEATSESWIASADSFGIPALEYERVLAWAGSHLNYSATADSIAYGIFEDGENEALAIADIVYSKRPGPDVGWLKLIEISLSPSFAPSEIDANVSKLGQVLDIFTTAIIGTIELTQDHRARVIKIYGRDEHLLSWLLAINERLRAALQATASLRGTWQSKMEGRWLVISIH